MKILSIAKYDFIKTFRDKTALLFIVLLPVVFTMVMGYIFGNAGGSDGARRIPVGIVNHDDSELTQELLNEVGRDNTIYIKELDEEQLYDQVKSARVEVGFIIPGDFAEQAERGQTPEIKVIKLPSSVDFMAIEGIVSTAFSKLQIKEAVVRYVDKKIEGMGIPQKDALMAGMEAKVSANLQKEDVVSVRTQKYSANKLSTDYDGKAQVSIGYAVMFVMFTVILSAGEILEEKKINTWGRLSITPTSKSTIMLGKIVGTFLTGWAQIIFLILFGRFVMGISWGNSLAATIIVMSIYLLSVTGMGLFLSSLVKTNAQLGAFSSIVIICTSMVSGCWWPVEMQPLFMQKIAVVFPQYWAMKGLTNTVVANLGLLSVVNHVIALVVIGAVFFILSSLSSIFHQPS